jgi:ABC-type Mn2+/Zn2+ transport system permease subunit
LEPCPLGAFGFVPDFEFRISDFGFQISDFGFEMATVASTSLFLSTLVTATALATACAVLSVVVVLRRWAFIGEGISHAGFGGAGTAWLLMVLFPALDVPGVTYAAVVVFSIATALAIGAMSREHGVHADAVIGIFLVASLAWGFLAQQVYFHARNAMPALFDNLLFGRIAMPFSPQFTRASALICIAVVIVVAGLWKEIVAYSFDPMLAETSGVRARFIHYLLMVLVALVIVLGVRLAGSVLVTALLVLPGATALLLGRRLTIVVMLSVAGALLGAVGGLIVNARWDFLPVGPAMVLILFVEFMLAYVMQRFRRRAS